MQANAKQRRAFLIVDCDDTETVATMPATVPPGRA